MPSLRCSGLLTKKRPPKDQNACPPRLAAFSWSTIRTRRPWSASSQAATRPARPAPTTMTSASAMAANVAVSSGGVGQRRIRSPLVDSGHTLVHQGEVDAVEHGLARPRLTQMSRRDPDPHDTCAPSGAIGRQDKRAAPPRLGKEAFADADNPRPDGGPSHEVSDSAQTGDQSK